MEHLDWGLKMTVLGMGLVFSLLALLWGLLVLVLALDKEEVEPEDDDTSDEAAVEPQVAVGGLPSELVSAIIVATLKHKALRGGTTSMMQTTCASNQPSPWAAAGRARQTNNWISRGK